MIKSFRTIAVLTVLSAGVPLAGGAASPGVDGEHLYRFHGCVNAVGKKCGAFPGAFPGSVSNRRLWHRGARDVGTGVRRARGSARGAIACAEGDIAGRLLRRLEYRHAEQQRLGRAEEPFTYEVLMLSSGGQFGVELLARDLDTQADFFYLAVPHDLELPPQTQRLFDPQVMQALAAEGRSLGRNPSSWRTEALAPEIPGSALRLNSVLPDTR